MILWRWYFFFALLLAPILCSADNERPKHVSAKIWERISPYVLPDNHRLKEKLDRLFAQGRPLSCRRALADIGFEHLTPQVHTGVIVASHLCFPKYLFKLYTDRQRRHDNRPAWQTWLLRIHGAEFLREEITRRGWNKWFTVPRKWIYVVPFAPTDFEARERQDFILVVERMSLVDNARNKVLWRKDNDEEKLSAFFYLLTYLGMWDSAKSENVPYCEDGTIAFIDTEGFGEWPVEYHKLFPCLQPKLRSLWRKLIAKSEQIERSQKAISRHRRLTVMDDRQK